MGQTTNEIEAHIEDTRSELGSNLHELEQKVKSATDWKQRFNKSPMTLLGVAFGGGVLLATMMGGRRNRNDGYGRVSNAGGSVNRPGPDHQNHKAMETWDKVKGALIGVAATRFTDFVNDVVPGFREQYRKTDNKPGTIAN